MVQRGLGEEEEEEGEGGEGREGESHPKNQLP